MFLGVAAYSLGILFKNQSGKESLMNVQGSEILVGIDVGADGHQIAIHVPHGALVYQGYVKHQYSAFDAVIKRLKDLTEIYQARVVIGIEGYNGHIAPFDQMLVAAGFLVLNVNPSRLYHFRRIFGAPYKNDPHDARLIAGYLKVRSLLDTSSSDSKSSLLPIKDGADVHKKLKSWSRYLNELIKEQTRLRNRLTKRLKEYLPELLSLAKQVNRKWLIILLAHCSRLTELQHYSIAKIEGFRGPTGYRIGPKKAVQIKATIKAITCYSPLEEEYAFIIKNYAGELMRLSELIKEVLQHIECLGRESVYYQVLVAQAGIDIRLAGRMIGEILAINNFASADAFAAYNGTCCLDHTSGKRKDDATRNVLCNKRLRTTMRDWAGCRIRCHAASRHYYDKKRAEGKTHNHALKCLSRQLSNLLYRILKKADTMIENNKITKVAA
jgi:transposase